MPDSKPFQIVICLGSSCFARGNKHIVQVVKQFLEEHKLSQKVDFRGKHCFGHCQHGPSIMINSRRFEQITADSVVEILQNELL